MCAIFEAVIPGRIEDANYDVQLHIGESRDSGFDASHRPGMTKPNEVKSP
jgi:DNA helicase II / ATP-dependent DNA helicase PcrA